MADFDKSIDLDKAFNKMVDDVVKVAEKLHKEGQEAGEAVGAGFDEGVNETVEKIKASSIKTERAFSKLSEKLRKQIQQFSGTLNGKNIKVKVDFSDIDIDSAEIKNRVADIIEEIQTQGRIEFDAKGSEQQFKNLITLFVKYKEKLHTLKQAYPNISAPKDAIDNLQQQLALTAKLREIYDFFKKPAVLFTGFGDTRILKDLETLQKFATDSKSESFDNYDELAKTLKEIQSSLKVISDVVSNESRSMQSMAQDGTTSFESLSQAIIGVYNNLTRVQNLVDAISQKDFNITNITNPVSTSTSKRQTVKQLKLDVEEELKHVKTLFQETDKLLEQLKQKKMANEAFKLLGTIGGVDEATGLPLPASYADFEKDILGQMADAKTKAKIENLLVLIDGYVAKLTEVNKLRSQYGFGEWQDPFVSNKQPTVKPDEHIENANALRQEAEAQKALNTAQKEEQIVQGSSEAQQMATLKTSVDDVSKAVGRKNAAFIKEQEIVSTSVEAEKAKLNELVTVITNEIGNALDNIKVKFAESFKVPELDKNNLKQSFDEIYSQFVELKNSIGAMEFDIGINNADITTAIQEALYAKEISKNYEKISNFHQVFDDFTWGYDAEAMNKFTNEILSLDDAREKFVNEFYGKFMSHDGKFIGDTSEMLSNLFQRLETPEPNQGEWAQVIVDAINTQGGNIVEAIKVILPKNPSDNIDGVDEAKLIDAFQTLSREIAKWTKSHGGSPGSFFRDILSGTIKSDHNTQNALRTLGLVSDSGKPQFIMPNTGLRNMGVAIADKTVVSSQHYGNMPYAPELQRKIDEAVQLGASIPRILDVSKEMLGFGTKAILALQERALGGNITDIDSSTLNVDTGFLKATDKQIDKLLHTFEVMEQVGLHFDAIGDNILFDEKAGFSVLDLSAVPEWGVTTNNPDEIVGKLINKITRGRNVPMQERFAFADRIRARAALPPEQRLWNKDIAAASGTKLSATEPSKEEVKLTPTMDEGAVAKVVAENVEKIPATVKIKPVVDHTNTQLDDEYDDYLTIDYDDLNIVDSALNAQQSVNDESQSAVDAAKAFVNAANAKKQFVEANKKVADGAKTSADAVKTEADAAKGVSDSIASTASSVAKDLAKIKTIVDKDGNTVHTSEVQKFKTDNAFVTETTNKDADDNVTSTTFVEDFEKLRAEAKKSEVAVAKAQTTLDEFLARFKSKTGGNAQFIEGFTELQNTTVTADNIDDVFNKMRVLQEKYSELEANFRKGQSSLNPFVNAINNSEKIGTIFADVEHKYNGLINKTQELTNDFERLKTLSEEISTFSKKMKVDAGSITSEDFTDFSKKVGEFNVLKAQIEGAIKTEGRRESDIEQKRKAEVEDYIKLIKQKNEYELKAAKGGPMQSFYTQQIQKIQDEIAQNDKQGIMNQEEKNRLLQIEKEHRQKIAEIQSKQDLLNKFQKQNDTLQGKFNAGYLSQANFAKWQTELAEYQSYLDGTVQADNATIEKKKASLTRLYDQLNRMSNSAKTFFASGGEILSTWFSQDEIQNAEQSLRALYGQLAEDRFAGMETSIKNVNGELGKLTFTVNDGEGHLSAYTIALNKSTGATKLLSGQSKETLTTLQQFGAALKGDIRGIFTAFIGGMSILHTVGRYIRDGIQSVKELDAALTELKKVTDETEATYDRFLETAAKTGARIGSTLANVTSATAEFAKLGYNIEQAASMAEAALVYTNVGDNIDVETGSQSIISTLKAFNIEANNTMSIVDKFNEIGKYNCL